MPGLPRVVITGPPASGKTTARDVVVGWLTGQGCSVVQISVDDALRSLYPREVESRDYAYDDDGALVLRRPREQIPPAVREAIDGCRRASARCGFVFELASNECVELLASGTDILAGCLVLALSAPVEVRSRRNARRRGTLIPDSRLRMYPDTLPDEWTRAFENAGAHVAGIDADRSWEAVSTEIVETVARRLD